MKYLYPTNNHFEIQSLASSDAQEDYEEDKKGNKIMNRSQVASCAQARVNELEQGHKDLTDNIHEFREIYIQAYSQSYKADDNKIYAHWIALQQKEGDVKQLCQDIGQLGEGDLQLECTPEHDHANDQDFYDIRFVTAKELDSATCEDLKGRKGVMDATFNEEREVE